MKIITAPNNTLREHAQAVTAREPRFAHFISELEDTLYATRNPKGVGLAAPQVATLYRVFATHLDDGMRVFINPEIINKSAEITFGPDKNDPYLEGCLSIPGLYGPVPRHHSLKLRYQVLEGNALSEPREEEFEDFPARVVQHEFDHLEGILFTDYTRHFNLPLYQGKRGGKLELIDASLVALY